jgi:hypothetical protein
MIINSPYISGSQTTTGNAVITGSLTVLGGIIGAITGSATSASFAVSASYASASTSASYAFNATSASYAFNSTSGSYALVATSASYASASTSASYAFDATSASYTLTSSNVQGGLSTYVPLWNTNTSLTSSYLNQSSNVLKTTYNGADKGLTLNYNFDSFILGNPGVGNNTYLQVFDGGSTINVYSPNYTYFNDKVGIGLIPTNPGLAVSGALEVTGSGTSRFINNNVQITGSLNVTNGITGSLLGTASYAANADLLDGRDSTTYANTGSNTFTNTQYVSATNNAISFTSTASFYTDGGMRITKDMYVSGNAFFNNVTIFGTQSISYITSSQLNIGTNIITVNTDTPTVRFGGLAVYDSGSTGLTGSMLWDSEDNHWIYSNPSGSSYDGGMIISGPRNSSGLGNEQGVNNCALIVGQGGNHVTSSLIMHYGNATCFYGNTVISSSGNACFSGQVCSNTVSTTDGTNVSQLANNYLRSTAGNFYFDACSVGASFNFRTSNASTLDNTAMFICGTNSRVGIGTTTPARQLTINGGSGNTHILLQNNSVGTAINNGFNLVFGLDCLAQVWNYQDASMTFGTNNTERIKITAAGITCFACQVCVPNIISTGVSGGRYGTFNAPTNGGYITFEAGGTSFGDLGSYCAQYGTGDATTLLLGSRTGYALALGTNSTEKVRIDTSGNLMVGSTSAGNAGTINVSVGCAGTTAGGIQLWAATNQTHFVQFGDGTAGNNPYRGYVSYAHGTDSLALGTSSTDRLTISSAGIACFACQVCAPAAAIGGQVAITAGNGNQLYLNNSGQQYTQITFDHNSCGLSRAYLAWDQTNSFFEMYATTGGGLKFFTNAANERLRITSTGIACFACQVCVPSLYSAFLFACTATALNSSLTNTAVTIEQRFGDVTGGGDYQGGSLLLMNNNGSFTWAGGAITATVGTTACTGGFPGGLAFWVKSASGGTGTSGINQAMRIDWAGRVGIGTATPTRQLTVASDTSFYNGASGEGAIDPGASEVLTAGFNVAGQSSLDISNISVTLDRWKAVVRGGFANNNEGGGLTSPSLEIEVDSNSPSIPVGNSSITFSRNSSTGKLRVTNNNTSNLRTTFVGTIQIINYPQSVPPTTSKIILGRVGIGTCTPADNLHIAASETGNVGISVQNTNASYSSQIRFLNAAGNECAAFTYVQSNNSLVTAVNSTNVFTIFSSGVSCFGATVCSPCFATISDYRMKSNLRPIDGLSIIMNTKTYKFNYNYDCSTSFGVIAHELQQVVPEAVFGEKDGEVMQGVDYMKLLPITIKAIQEQQCTICSQALTINTLKTCLGIA